MLEKITLHSMIEHIYLVDIHIDDVCILFNLESLQRTRTIGDANEEDGIMEN